MPWLLKIPRPVIFGGMTLLVVLAVFLIGKCMGGNNDRTTQVEQTNRSGEAVANAAEMAIDTIGGRVATDTTIDQAVQQATQEIDRAENADAVRNAVINSLCAQYEHRNDPACLR